MLASNYQMPANGWNGIIELSLEGSEKWEETQSFGSCGTESWWESFQACPDLSAEVRDIWDVPRILWHRRQNSCYWIITDSGLLEFSKFLNEGVSQRGAQHTLAVLWWNAEEVLEFWNRYCWKSPLRALSPMATTTPHMQMRNALI